MKNKHVMIVENSENKISQSDGSTNNKMTLNGIFTEFDVENRNKRIYTAENFVPVMNSTLLAKKAKLGVVYGEYDHPDVFDVSGKNASHVIESLTYNKNDNRIDGAITLLNTFYGKQAKAIIEDGHPLFVSSRAAGVTDSYGRVELKELFTYDIVLDPGFASARVQPKYINESLGFSDDDQTNFRIYEMSDEDVHRLFKDNKNDIKTSMDLTKIEQFMKDELVKYEFKITEMINNAKFAPEEIKSLMEQIETIKSELESVNKYLSFLQPKMTTLIEQNSKLVESNKKLENEITETVLYANHLASGMKKVNTVLNSIDERLNVNEKFTQYVAEHTKANILYSDEIANEQSSITEMLEYVAEHVKNNKEFLEYVAEESHIIGLFAEQVARESNVIGQFAENVANETKDTQDFLNYVANEKYKDEVWLSYVAEKVDGMIKYQGKFVDIMKGDKINESNSELAKLETLDQFLGITEEQEMINNINEDPDASTATATVTEVEPVISADNAATATTDAAPATTTATNVDTNNTDTNSDNDNDDDSLEAKLLNKLVKILTCDETGIVIEIKPDNVVVIQKSGNDELVEVSPEEVETIETTENYLESVNAVLAAINKQKALENQAPHFFTFLNETQITNFKGLDKNDQANIILKMNEAEYFNADDVLAIIADHLNQKAASREETLLNNMPEELKEGWNALADDIKKSTLNESIYFNIKNLMDIHSFWSTRQFAKALKSPEATMLKESANNTLENNTKAYEEAFLKAYNSLK